MAEFNTLENQESTDDIPVIPDDWALPDVFCKRIQLANGETINGYAKRSNIADEVWVYPEDPLSTMEIVMLFGNPANTRIISSDISETEHVEYHGYTNLMTIDYGTGNRISIRMTKPITA